MNTIEGKPLDSKSRMQELWSLATWVTNENPYEKWIGRWNTHVFFTKHFFAKWYLYYKRGTWKICYNDSGMMEEIQADSSPDEDATQSVRRQRWMLVGVIAGLVLLLAAIGAAVFGLTRDEVITANIRDIFIIFMAFESLIIGAALVILVIQVASLINLLQNEVKPILQVHTFWIRFLENTT